MVEERKQNEDLTNLEVTIGGESKKDYPLLPEFIYLRSKLTNIDKKATKNGDRVRFVFNLTDKKYEGRKAWGSVALYTNPSKETGLYAWIQMLLGRKVQEGEKVTLGQFKGRLYDIVLENSKTTDKNGKPYQNVTKVKPVTQEEQTETSEIENEELPVKTEQEVEQPVKEESNTQVTEEDLPF
jgi:hypothetical protein